MAPMLANHLLHHPGEPDGVVAEEQIRAEVRERVSSRKPGFLTAYLLALEKADVARCSELLGQYRDLHIGLADATIVAAAERLRVFRLLSFDHRHFHAIVPRNSSHFVLLPADAT